MTVAGRRKEVVLISDVDLGLMSYDRAIRVLSRELLSVVALSLSNGMDAAAIMDKVAPLISLIDDCDAMLR